MKRATSGLFGYTHARVVRLFQAGKTVYGTYHRAIKNLKTRKIRDLAFNDTVLFADGDRGHPVRDIRKSQVGEATQK